MQMPLPFRSTTLQGTTTPPRWGDSVNCRHTAPIAATPRSPTSTRPPARWSPRSCSPRGSGPSSTFTPPTTPSGPWVQPAWPASARPPTPSTASSTAAWPPTWGRESWRGDLRSAAARRSGRIRARSLRVHSTNRLAVVLSRLVLTSPVTLPPSAMVCRPYPARRSLPLRASIGCPAGDELDLRLANRWQEGLSAARERCNTNGSECRRGT
jgi:hypothetical protein